MSNNKKNPLGLSENEYETLLKVEKNLIDSDRIGISGFGIKLSEEEERKANIIHLPISEAELTKNKESIKKEEKAIFSSSPSAPVIVVDKILNKQEKPKEDVWLDTPEIDVGSYTPGQIKQSDIEANVLDLSDKKDIIEFNKILNKQKQGLIRISTIEKQFSQSTGNWKILIIYTKLLFKKILI